MTTERECYCGAIIHQANFGLPDPAVWVDGSGSSFCYEEAEGADGQARHEPLEDIDD